MKRQSFRTVLTFALLGLITLLLGSFLQKIIIHAVINIKGFIVPIIYGTGVGTIAGIFFNRSKILVEKIKKTNSNLKHSEKELNETIRQLNLSTRKLKELNVDLLIAKERAEDSDELKDEFLKNLNHEIRTPMNAIVGFSNLLYQVIKLNDKACKYVEYINQNSDRLLKTIDSILEISLIYSNQVIVSSELIDLEEFFTRITDKYRTIAVLKGIKLKLYLNNSIQNVEFESDAAKLETIVSNLLDNAIKYTHEGDVWLKARLESSILKLEIGDSGIGIEAIDFEKIFVNFYSSNSELDKQKGIGLGLSIAQKYAVLLGGMISLKSVKNEGSVFYIDVPPISLNTAENISIYADDNKLNIIVADVDYFNYLFIVKLFDSLHQHFNFFYTNEKEELLEKCKKNPELYLIFIDLNLVQSQEFNFLKEIESLCPKTFFIAMSSDVDNEQIAKAAEYGFTDYLIKPFGIKDLRKLIEKNR
jgi:signal transduction histidine kinase/CheY-like chemotaxis protein